MPRIEARQELDAGALDQLRIADRARHRRRRFSRLHGFVRQRARLALASDSFQRPRFAVRAAFSCFIK